MIDPQGNSDPSLCSKCAAGGQRCRACLKLWGVEADGSCVPCRIDHCTSCASDTYKCWGCEPGYKLDAGACLK